MERSDSRLLCHKASLSVWYLKLRWDQGFVETGMSFGKNRMGSDNCNYLSRLKKLGGDSAIVSFQ